MGAFEYLALDKSGKNFKGLLEGDTAKHVRQILRDRNMHPIKVTEVARKESGRQRNFIPKRRLSAGELALVTRQLATLSQVGLPLEEALLVVSQQNEDPRIQSILLGVRSRVMEGHTLATGLSDFPHAFPELYRTTIAAGRTIWTPRCRAGTPRELHRIPTDITTAGQKCTDLSDRTRNNCHCDYQFHDGLRCSESRLHI